MSEFANYSAPRGDGTSLCEPAIGEWGHFASDSRSRLPSDIRWSGVELHRIREWTQRDAIRHALEPLSHNSEDITSGTRCLACESEEIDFTKLWFVSGHQPELFHPGVWFKNFVLWAAAKQHNAYSLNVIIDHDVVTPISVLVPALDENRVLHAKLVMVPEDVSAPREANIPWELYFDKFSMDWQKFDEEVCQWTATLGIDEPLIKRFSISIRESIARGLPVGESIALARHQCEISAGIENFEVTFSKLAKERGFAAYVFEILSNIDTFRAIYHEARQVYRHHHRIKNASQPIPALSEQTIDGNVWHEAPFWIYRNDDPVRRALWVRTTDKELLLSDLQGWQSQIDRKSNFEDVYKWWQELIGHQVAIRPRALTTTLFLRLAIGDLFLHGIGGGKYDQITDRIIERWCNMKPPTFAVATATLHLPMTSLPQLSDRSTSTRDIRNRMRDWRCNPERLADPSNAKVKALLIQLESRLKQTPYGSRKKEWHESIQRIKHELRMMLAEGEVTLAAELQKANESERQRKIQTSREYSIAIFPNGATQQRLQEMACATLECEDLSPLLDKAASGH